MSELVGHDLGQYHITEEIAKGGMATVYLARQKNITRNVAVKVLPRNFTHDDTFIERFNREVKVIAALQHPHILPVYDFGEYDDMPYIVMAYIDGGTLAERIAQGAMPMPDVLELTRQMADALDFAHSKDIIHRDIKPGNVLLDSNGNSYLADFGLAKVRENAVDITAGNIVGTPAYMAPEQAGPGDESSRIDVYALGVLVYEMLTGELPYGGDSPTQVLMAHLTQPVPNIHDSNPDLPDFLQDVIDQAMAKAPSDRYASAGALYNALANADDSDASANTLGQMPVHALLMTNDAGDIIFLDNQCLRILKRKQYEARNIMGQPMHTVLGIEAATVKTLLADVARNGAVDSMPLDITDARGRTRPVLASASATTDDQGKFIGADVQLHAVPTTSDSSLTRAPSKTMSFKTQEISHLRRYTEAQIDALYTLLQNWAGKRVAAHLEAVINELGKRNEWTITMQDGAVNVELDRVDTDIYRALMARSIDYAAHILGDSVVRKELIYVNKQLDNAIVQQMRELGMDNIYNEILDT